MSATAVAIPPSDSQPSKSFLERLIGVFISPGETFADIARKPDFIAPLLVSTVMAIAVTETMLAKIGMERIVRMSIEQSSRASSMTPEQMDQAVSNGVKFGSIIAHVAGVLGAPIFLTILAALGLLFVNAIFGGQINYHKSLAVTSYASLCGLLNSTMGLALILFGDPEHFNSQNFVPSNPAFFLPPDTSKPVMTLLGAVDVFSIWLMILLGIGFSAAATASGRKVKASTIFLCFLGLRLVLLVIQTGFSMLG